MKIFAAFLLILIASTFQFGSSETVGKILEGCNKQGSAGGADHCKETVGPYCFSYSKKDASNDTCDQFGAFKLSTPCLTLGSFERAANGHLKVKLIGEIGGSGTSYIGIVFADTGDIAKDGTLGVICRTGITGKNSILLLKNPIVESAALNVEKEAPATKLKPAAAGTVKEKTQISCEFELPGLDLSKSYKVGLMRGEIKGEIYQGMPFTSDKDPLDVFPFLKKGATTLDEPIAPKPDSGAAQAQLAAAITLVGIALIL